MRMIMCIEKTLSMEELLQKLEISISNVRSTVENINALSSNYGLESHNKGFDKEDKQVFVDALKYQRQLSYDHRQAINCICQEVADRAKKILSSDDDEFGWLSFK